MCMDQGPFELVRGDSAVNLSHVVSILPGDGSVKLIDAMGGIEVVEGAIAEIDLLNRRLVMVE